MAPMIRQDTMDLLDECLDMAVYGVNFEEISKLATSGEIFDNSCVEVGPQPPVVVQPADPETTTDLPNLTLTLGDDFLFDNTKLLEGNGMDASLQPASTLQQPQLLPQEYFNSDSAPASPEFLVLQPATPEPLQQQPLSVVSAPQQALDTQPASPEFFVLQPATCEASQETFNPASVPQLTLGQEPTIQYLDLPQLSASIESMVASPADSFVLSPSPSSQESLLSPSPAPQLAVDAPKKRGRKRKYPEGMAPSRRRPRKPKVYEMGPMDDDEQERKRRNALNAKRHRDMQKQQKQELTIELAQARAERDKLQEMVNQLQQREQELLRTLNMHGLHHTLDGL